MPNFSRTVTVKQDINMVYDFMSDFRNLNKWAEGDEGELITKEPLRLGSVFRVKTHFNNKPRVYDYEVVEWGPPLRLSLEDKDNYKKLFAIDLLQTLPLQPLKETIQDQLQKQSK